MSFFEWLTIFFVCLIGAMTPGPSLFVIIYLTNSKNFISGLVASFAHGFGVFIYALISIFSLTIIVSVLPSIIPIIQLLGAVFLIYLGSKIIINHLGGSSHNKSINFEMELSRNWHWMWSTFYYNKKYNGFFFALVKVSGKLTSAFLKIIFYTLFFQKNKRRIYYQRFLGLINSIFGKKSSYRPKIF